MDRARGIDVSHHQQNVNWSAVYDSGVRFAGIKCREGASLVDPQFANNRMGVRSNPFDLVIYYAFLRPGRPDVQADALCDTVGQLRSNERLCADLEDDKNGKPAVDLKFVDAFYTRLLRGVCSALRPLLYTSRRIWLQLSDPVWDLASEIDLWAPRYGPDEPRAPKPWLKAGWTIWQNDDTGRVPGVNGPCDINVFNGDAAALKAYAAVRAL